MTYNDLFHVHTFRCGHAGKETDTDYIEKAISLKANSLYFTDHAPFPGNIFGNRMRIEELDEYIKTLTSLKEKYQSQIDIKIGLEIEYIPSFMPYYEYLKDKYNLHLFLGQHICLFQGHYNFEYQDKSEEYKWMTDSILEALDTGLFDVLLHPERIYKNSKEWEKEQEQSAKIILQAAENQNIPIEYNYSSINTDNIKYWHEKFWKIEKRNRIVYGIDAHSTKELSDGTHFFRNL